MRNTLAEITHYANVARSRAKPAPGSARLTDRSGSRSERRTKSFADSGYSLFVKKQDSSPTKRPFAALTGLGAIAALALAAPASAAMMSAQDTSFVHAAAQGGMAEVAAGNLAEQRSTNPHVKAFATKMVSDHSANNAKLASIAKMKNIMLPTSVGETNMKMKGALETLHGTAFDTSYMQGQKTGHMQMESVMKAEIANGKDADLVAFAKATLPTVEAHLAMDEKDLAMMSKSMSGMKMSGTKM
jgi:putative membrane protein